MVPGDGLQLPVLRQQRLRHECYKTIGYEIVDQLGRAPEHRGAGRAGDAFTGTWKGLREYQRAGVIDEMPRLHAAEVYGPLEHALAENLDDCVEMPVGDQSTVAMPVGSNPSTYQALNVLRDTGGSARSADNAEMLAMQRQPAALEAGVYVETSSVLSLAAPPSAWSRHAGHVIDPDSTVVAELTSTGLKHPEVTAEHSSADPRPWRYPGVGARRPRRRIRASRRPRRPRSTGRHLRRTGTHHVAERNPREVHHGR